MRSVQLDLAQQQRAEVARQRVRQDQLDRQEALKVEQIRLRHQTEEDARREVITEADRRERAWTKFYWKPATCNEAASMECANGFIRAKKSFEEKYARGEL